VALSRSAEVFWGHGRIDMEWFSAAATYLLTYWKSIFLEHAEAFAGLMNFNNSSSLSRTKATHYTLSLS
jgi:hypothetical protein